MNELRPWRFRRDLHPLVTRLTTVRLDDFGFGTHWRGCDKGWELVVMHHESRFRLGFMTADLQSASRDNTQ